MSAKSVTTVNLEDHLVEWADENYSALGYNSRSAMLNSLLADEKERVEGEDA